ncbi:MAG: hypothetical protein EXQ84_00930 [Rhodospirillaceae bacterium]|nr:hypothetical protein [Rhodospirillaceae bacterium]
MRRGIVVLWSVMSLAAANAEAQDVPLVADLSNHLVAITTGFTGTDVLLFGATDGPGDIVVVVRGPAKDEVVRRKSRFGPVWANAEAVTFRDVPSYYRVASNRPLQEFAPEMLLERRQIGVDTIRLSNVGEAIPPDQAASFRKALLRLRTADNLYDQGVGDIAFMSNRLFRTALHFPANVPTGTYMVEVYLFREGQIISAEIVPLNVSKIGIGAEIFDFAQGRFAFFYGLMAVLLAGGAGWVAGVVFRRV